MSSYQHKSGAIKRREKQQRVNAEKKGSRTLFDVGAHAFKVIKDNAESGSEAVQAELEQESQDIPAQTVVIEPRRETSEVEITYSGAYHTVDADVEDEADVDDDDNSEKRHLTTCGCEEDGIKSAPIARFSFDVGTLTGSPTPNELEEIVRAGHIPHPSQFPCDAVGNKFPTSVLKVRKQNGETSSRSRIVFSPTKEAIYCFPCRLFSHTIDQPTQSSLASPGGWTAERKWKKLWERVPEHEKSDSHKKCYFSWLELQRRLENDAGIDVIIEGNIFLKLKNGRNCSHE